MSAYVNFKSIGVVSHVNQGEHAVGGNAGGQPDGAAPSSSSGAAGGGRDDDPGRGNNRRNANDAELDEESHEAQSGETSSTSSGLVVRDCCKCQT